MPSKKQTKGFWLKFSGAGVKGVGGAACGAIVAAAEEIISESAGVWADAGIAIAGVAGLVLVDPDESPHLATMSDVGVIAGGRGLGYRGTKAGIRKAISARRETRRAADLEALRKDMGIVPEQEEGAQKENGVAKVEVPAAAPKGKPVPAPAS